MEDDFIPDMPMEQGAIENPNNFLERIIRNAGPNTMNMGAMGTGSGATNSEDILPSALQTIGNIGGGAVGLQTMGRPNLGAAIGGGIGRSVGSFGKELEKSWFRDEPFDENEFYKESALGAGTEAVNLPFASIGSRFLSGPARKEFLGKIGETLGYVMEQTRKGKVKVPVSRLAKTFSDTANNIRKHVEVDPSISKFLEDLGMELKNKASKKFGLLDSTDIQNTKSKLDKFLELGGIYDKKVKGKARKAYGAMGEVIGSREIAGETLQGMTEKAGVGDTYKTARKAYGTVAKSYPALGKHPILKSMLEAGGIGNLIRGDLMGAIGELTAAEALGSNALQKSVWNLGKLGKVLPTGIAELISQSE